MQARLRVLGVVFLAGALLVPVSVAAGAEEHRSERVWLQAEAPEGNPDLRKVSNHLLAARSLGEAGASASEVAAATAAAIFSDGLPLLELRFDVLSEATISLVERIGFRSVGTYPEYGVMSGYADLALLEELSRGHGEYIAYSSLSVSVALSTPDDVIPIQGLENFKDRSAKFEIAIAGRPAA